MPTHEDYPWERDRRVEQERLQREAVLAARGRVRAGNHQRRPTRLERSASFDFAYWLVAALVVLAAFWVLARVLAAAL